MLRESYWGLGVYSPKGLCFGSQTRELSTESADCSWLHFIGRFACLWLVGNGRMVVMVLIIVPIPPFPTNQRQV